MQPRPAETCRLRVPPRATSTGGKKVTAERLFWHCGAYTAWQPKVVTMVTIPTIPHYQDLLFFCGTPALTSGGWLSLSDARVRLCRAVVAGVVALKRREVARCIRLPVIVHAHAWRPACRRLASCYSSQQQQQRQQLPWPWPQPRASLSWLSVSHRAPAGLELPRPSA